MNQVMQAPFLISQSNTDLPELQRASADPNGQGTHTFDGRGSDRPVSVDSQGHAVFGSTAYLILAVLLIGAVILALVLKRIPQPAQAPPGDVEGNRAHPL